MLICSVNHSACTVFILQFIHLLTNQLNVHGYAPSSHSHCNQRHSSLITTNTRCPARNEQNKSSSKQRSINFTEFISM